MYIETIPNRNSPPAILLRESYREGGRVKKRTLVNLTKLPGHVVEGLRTLLKGGQAVDNVEDTFEIIRSLPYGHVAATLGVLRRIGLDRIIGEVGSLEHQLVLAMIVARIIDPRSKLATCRGLGEETSFSSLGEMLGVTRADEDELYAAMDWLHEKQEAIETELAGRHLEDGALVLYDVTSTYFEGRTCPLAQRGYNRDKKKGKLQIVFGLLCNSQGCPVSVEVFSGKTGDPSTLKNQIDKIINRFKLKRVILVGDRGMITDARIREDLNSVKDLDWITALRFHKIRELYEDGSIQMSLFDETDLAEITHADYPGQRLIVCRNPYLTDERTRKREELLRATERELDKIVQATQRTKRKLKGKDKIGIRVGKVLKKFKVGKHFLLNIQENSFSYERNDEKITREKKLDGFYVIRTTVSEDLLDAEHTVSAYKDLSSVERAFRSYKSVDLKVRPIHHRLENRVRSHVFLCMLAYYVEWHMRKDLAPILFDDHDPQTAKMIRESAVAPAQRSPETEKKVSRKRTEDDFPVHSFQTLLADLATITKNKIQPTIKEVPPFDKLAIPTPLQQRALDLLGVRIKCTQ